MAALPPPPPPAPPPLYAGVYAGPAPYAMPPARQRTAAIVLAQVLMVVKGILWLIAGLAAAAAGIYYIVHGGDIQSLPGRHYPGFDAVARGVLGLAAGFVIGIALVCVTLGVLDIVLGVFVGRPSNTARWLTVATNCVAGAIALLGLVGTLNHNSTGAGGAAFFGVWLVVNIVIFYALVIDERSRPVFA